MSSFDSIASTLWLLLNTPMIPPEQASEQLKDVPLKEFSTSVTGTSHTGVPERSSVDTVDSISSAATQNSASLHRSFE